MARRTVAATLILAVGGAYVAHGLYHRHRVAQTVRKLVAAHRYDAAREPLRRWLQEQPGSGEAYYYKAWLALTAEQAPEAAEAIVQATNRGFDRAALNLLSAIYQAYSNRFSEAEPTLRQAYDARLEPQAEVAKALARVYLSTYRLSQAAELIQHWKTLAPEDPLPYLWSNEVTSRSTDVVPLILIQNYRAALERDPSLDKARLGLAEQLSKDLRFDEAEEEYRACLKRNPKNAMALVGLGRNAFQHGDLQTARQYFEAAVEADPREPAALKELAQTEMRTGRLQQACERFKVLVQIEPYDHEIRYMYSQVLNRLGDEAQFRVESELAVRLRKEHDEFLQLGIKLVQGDDDLESRFRVAKWMLEHGHHDEGLNWTNDILRTQPRHAPTHRLLADYYRKHGDAGLANYHSLMASTGQDSGPGTSNDPRSQTP
jgi:tetratricopeptide (TPR) repeat protein